MKSLNDFKKLAKSDVLNTRFIVGGKGTPTEYGKGRGKDDYKYDDGTIVKSDTVPRGGSSKADPKLGSAGN